MSIAGFFYGVILIFIGFLILKYNYQVTNMFSRNNVFERYLGSGSTYFVMKIAGLLVMLLGLLMMFGLADDTLRWLVSPLTNLISR